MLGQGSDVVGKALCVLGQRSLVVGMALEWSACGRLCLGMIGHDVQVLQLEKKKEENKMGSRQGYI